MKEWKKGRKVIVRSTGEQGRVHEVNYYVTDPGYPADIDTITVDIQGTKVEYSENQLLTHKQAYKAPLRADIEADVLRKAQADQAKRHAESQVKLIEAGYVPVAVLRQLAVAFPTLQWNSEAENTLSFADTGSQRRVFHYGTPSIELRNNGSFSEAYLQAIGEALR